MATNGVVKFKYNMITGSTVPLRKLGLFRAGADQPVKAGEILEKTYSTETTFVPLDSDFDHTGTDDALAVSDEEIKSGDRAGYYWVIVPRPGDVFECPLASASSMAIGTALTYSSSQALTTGGSHPIGYACGQDNYPTPQGHLSDDVSPDSGTTVKSTSYVQFTFKTASSWYKTFEQ